ncbi:MAG: hypothetical protein NVS3B24_14670 [Candidatus Dormibacteria bacterium]
MSSETSTEGHPAGAPGSSRLQAYRRARDAFFARHPHSPLSPSQREGFTGLRYFPENPGLSLVLPWHQTQVTGEVPVATSKGGLQTFLPAGEIYWGVNGVALRLILYSSGEHGLFLPFKDATSGHVSYGGGRYLDVALPRDGRVTVDFNYAYNPFCAYNPRWECPLPPPQNIVAVPVEAGELVFSVA